MAAAALVPMDFLCVCDDPSLTNRTFGSCFVAFCDTENEVAGMDDHGLKLPFAPVLTGLRRVRVILLRGMPIDYCPRR